MYKSYKSYKALSIVLKTISSIHSNTQSSIILRSIISHTSSLCIAPSQSSCLHSSYSYSTSSHSSPSFLRRFSFWSDSSRSERKNARAAELKAQLHALPVVQLDAMRMSEKPGSLATASSITNQAQSQSLIVEYQSKQTLNIRNIMDEPLVLPELFQNKITLLSISYNQAGMNNSHTWMQAFAENTHTDIADTNKTKISESSAVSTSSTSFNSSLSLFQSYQFSMVDNAIVRSLFSGMTIRNTRQQFPPHRHPNIAILMQPQQIQHLQANDNLKILDKTLWCQLFLIDWSGKVRWRAFGEALGNDLNILKNVTEQLQDEWKEKQNSRKRK